MSETFLSRWSRRKRAASIPPPASEASGGEGGEDRRSEPGGGEQSQVERTEALPTPDPSPPRASRAGGGEPRGPVPQETEFDPASLPPLESIDAGTDVSGFLRPGVPADLAQAALRRAWVTDPAIRDFVGPAENSWDFTAPGGVPGFGPLRAIDDVQRLAAQIIGALPAAPPETPPAEGEETGGIVQARDEGVAEYSRPETAPPADNAAVQNDHEPENMTLGDCVTSAHSPNEWPPT